MERIGLDQPTLKALAGETRVKILKLLDTKQMTPSDIANELKMSLPTVGEHLKALVDAELVEKEATTRKWKYYSLTQKSRMLLHPNTSTIWFVLGLFLFSAAATVLSAIKYFTPMNYGAAAPRLMMAKAEAAPMLAAAPTAADNLAGAVAAVSPVWLVSFGAATLVLLIVLIVLLKKYGWLGKSLTNKKNI